MVQARREENFLPNPWWHAYFDVFCWMYGDLMANTGLSDQLKSAFGGVEKMLSGKNFPQNTRALRVCVEEILQSVL